MMHSDMYPQSNISQQLLMFECKSRNRKQGQKFSLNGLNLKSLADGIQHCGGFLLSPPPPASLTQLLEHFE